MPQFLHGYVYVFSHACITVCGVNFHPVTVCFKFTLRSGVVLPPFKLSNRNRLSISQPSPGKKCHSIWGRFPVTKPSPLLLLNPEL